MAISGTIVTPMYILIHFLARAHGSSNINVLPLKNLNMTVTLKNVQISYSNIDKSECAIVVNLGKTP